MLPQCTCAGGAPGRLGLLPWTTDLLYSVIKQVVRWGIWQREAQDLLMQEVHRGPRLGVWQGWSPLLSHHSSSRSPEPLSSGGLEIRLAKTSLCKKTSVSTRRRRTRLRLNLGVFFSLFPVSVPFFLVNDLLNGAPDGDVGQVLETVNCQGCHVTGRASVSLTDWQG